MKDYPLGALINELDNRDIPLSAVASAMGIDTAVHPKKNITDISMLPIEDQKRNGSCVGQAEGKDAEFKNFLETGKVVRLSKRALYALCKAEDGNPGEGTYPRVAAKIRVSIGVPKESLVKDDNSLSHADFINVVITPEIKTDASETRSKGYSFVTTLDELKTAIDVTKAFNATLQVGDWSKLPVKPVNSDGSNRGNHRIWIFGYEDALNGKVEDTKVYYLNSWGIKWATGKNSADRKLLEKGVGYFWWSEYVGSFRDGIVYIDMPNEIIDYAKSQAFIFPRQLQRGMSGTDVIELQKRLSTEIALDKKPCYESTVFDTSFGPITERAVQRYQAVKGIVSHGTPSTTGYGRVGALTLASLNKGTTPPPTPKKSMLDKWADAIQHFEGWFPGSKSFRNNNPGNIRYIGQKRATGQDSTGFCIFASYADGRQELIDLLLRATSGKSTIYRPEMSLLQFYEKYAPSSDNNYPDVYAKAVAKMIGVSVSSRIVDIVNGTAKLSSNASTGSTKNSMNNITSSASKLVLLYIVAILGVLALTAGIFSIVTGTFGEASKEIISAFGTVITLVLGYYFGYKGETPKPKNDDEEVQPLSGFGK